MVLNWSKSFPNQGKTFHIKLKIDTILKRETLLGCIDSYLDLSYTYTNTLNTIWAIWVCLEFTPKEPAIISGHPGSEPGYHCPHLVLQWIQNRTRHILDFSSSFKGDHLFTWDLTESRLEWILIRFYFRKKYRRQKFWLNFQKKCNTHFSL